MRTAVWMVLADREFFKDIMPKQTRKYETDMWRHPAIRAPLSGRVVAYFLRMYMRPGISFWKGGIELFSIRRDRRQTKKGVDLGDFDFLATEGGEGKVLWTDFINDSSHGGADGLTSNFEGHIWSKRGWASWDERG